MSATAAMLGNRWSRVKTLQRFERPDELSQLAARHFDDENNARRDFGHAHAARVAGREKDLDGLGAGVQRLPREVG